MAGNNPNITIKFEAKGHKPLIDALKELNKQQKKLGNAVRNTGAAVKGFGQRVDKATDTAKKQNSAINSLNANIAIYRNRLLLAAFAIGMYSKTIGKLTSLYAKQELAEKKLSTALGKTSKELLNFASAQQAVTVFGDEVTIQVMAQIAAFTKNEEAIKRITVASQDMASGKGMDLVTTTDLITKSIFSSTNALSRYAIEIDNSLKGQERLDAILSAINEKWGGQATAELDTYSGAVKALGNTFGDLGEGVGGTLGQALLPLIKALSSFGELLKQINPKILTNALASLAVAVLLNSTRLKGLAKSLFGVKEGMTKTAVATKALRSAFTMLARSAGIFLVLEAAQEMFKIFSSPLVTKSEQNTQNMSKALSDFDKDLIAVSRSLPKSMDLVTKAQSEFDDALASAEKALLDAHGARQKGMATSAIVGLLGVLSAKSGDYGDAIDRINQFQNISVEQQEKVNKAQETYNGLIDGSSEKATDLANAKIQVQNIEGQQLKVLNDLLPNLKKENEQLELKILYTGRELALAQAKAIIQNSNVDIGKKTVSLIMDEINRKYDLIEVTNLEKTSLTELNKIRSEHQKILNKTAPFSTYMQLLIDKKDVIKDGVDIMKSELLTEEDKIEASKLQVEILKALNLQIQKLKAQGLDIVFKEDEDAINKATDKIKALNKEIKNYNLSQRSELKVLEDKKKVYQSHFITLKSGTKEYKETAKAIQNLNKEIKEATPIYGDYTELIEDMTAKNVELETATLSQTEILENYIEGIEEGLVSLEKQIQGNEALANIYAVIVDLLAQLRKNMLTLNDEFGYFEQIGVDALKGLHTAIATTLGEFNKINMITWDTFGNNVAQVMKQIAAQAIATGFFKLLAMLLDLGSGGLGTSMLKLMGIPTAHQGGEIQGYATGGMIPMQGYATGGGVDNVPIMAQEGEYVINRRAVESIGVENLNRMNRTGQSSGGVNVTFSGNVMSRDFIEEEAIPQIKDAIRRGADIGIS